MRWARFFLAVYSGLVFGQSDYPSRAVRIVVPSPPAGGTDIVARVLAQHFAKSFGQQFFVENRPGAGNMIGIEAVARSAPDGYTLLMTASTLALNSVLFKKVPYDPVRDFAPITLTATAPNVLLVHPSVPAQSLAEFIALARAKPGALSYGTPGIGTSPHLSMELLKSMAGIDLQHVPYKGTAAAVTDVIGGQIAATFSAGCARWRSPGRGASKRCRAYRRSRKQAFRATRRCSGTGCSRRRARPPRSSSASTPRR